MWVHCIYDVFLSAWFVVEHSLVMTLMCQSVNKLTHGKHWNSPHHGLSTVIDSDKGFFSVESVRRRTQGALIPRSLFSWMSAPLTVQAEGGGLVITPRGTRWTAWCWGRGLVGHYRWLLSDVKHPFNDPTLQLFEWHVKDSAPLPTAVATH